MTKGEIKAIDIESISFTEKDVIVVSKKSDFIKLLRGEMAFKLGRTYYIVCDIIVYVWHDGTKQQ